MSFRVQFVRLTAPERGYCWSIAMCPRFFCRSPMVTEVPEVQSAGGAEARLCSRGKASGPPRSTCEARSPTFGGDLRRAAEPPAELGVSFGAPTFAADMWGNEGGRSVQNTLGPPKVSEVGTMGKNVKRLFRASCPINMRWSHHSGHSFRLCQFSDTTVAPSVGV